MDEIENERHLLPSTLGQLIELETETTEIENEKGKEGKKRKARLLSDVWDHFTMIEGGDPMVSRAACNYCGKYYVANQGTSSLWTHYNHQCKRKPKKVDENTHKVMGFEAKKEGVHQVDNLVQVLTEEACSKAIARYIVSEELPVGIVEGEGFRMLLNGLLPNYDAPSRATIADEILKMGLDKGKIEKIFKK